MISNAHNNVPHRVCWLYIEHNDRAKDTQVLLRNVTFFKRKLCDITIICKKNRKKLSAISSVYSKLNALKLASLRLMTTKLYT
jgi:hypothetical protein